jgi:hypothetical protein
MIKVRIQGTTNDIKWFKKVIERNKKIKISSISEPLPNKGTKKYFRMYADIERIEE